MFYSVTIKDDEQTLVFDINRLTKNIVVREINGEHNDYGYELIDDKRIGDMKAFYGNNGLNRIELNNVTLTKEEGLKIKDIFEVWNELR